MVNSSGRVLDPEPEPWVAEGEGAAALVAAADVAAAEGVASAAAEVAAAEEAGAAALVAAADVAAADEAAAVLDGVVEPEPDEAPSQTLGPGMV